MYSLERLIYLSATLPQIYQMIIYKEEDKSGLHKKMGGGKDMGEKILEAMWKI